MRTFAALARALADGSTTSRALVEACLARIAAPGGQGARAFLTVHAEAARAAAAHHDRQRRAGAAVSPFAGIPVSIKDLFDVAGDVTTAGSTVLRDRPPAAADAPAVARWRAAGLIPIGRTNMTEFAYSGLGLNPHYGTPLSPFERARGRIAGGSSSGAAVSVCDAMAYGALGTDTGGSCRIPAAFCGIVGFKPTAARVPLAGAFPLAPSLDSIGPLASSVECCATLDALLAGEPPAPLQRPPAAGLRFAVPTSYLLDGLAPEVAASYARALATLTAAGATLVSVELPELERLPDINRKGGLAAAEAWAIHRERLATHGADYDPRVAARLRRGAEQDAADHAQLLRERARLQAEIDARLLGFDAVLMPTTPILPPTLAELEADADYGRINLLVLRNPSVVNFLDRCAISLPCHAPGAAPVGLSLMGGHGQDRRLLAIAATVAALVSPPLAAD